MRTWQFIIEAGLEIDAGDRWGSTVGILFGMADALYHADQPIPAHWEYRHSPVCTELPEDEYDAVSVNESVIAGYVTWADVVRAGNVLIRYAHVLERAGHSY